MRFARNPRRIGGRLRAPATLVLAAALVAVYFGFQGGGLATVSRSIEFRCNAVEYGLIPYEVTHPGTQLADPYCQPQPESHEGHDHPRSDARMPADAPTWLTPLSATFMHGGLVQLLGSVLFLLIFAPRLERRLGAPRVLALFLLAGLVSAAALVALAPRLPIATVSAAGAVSGVIGAHLALLPRTSLTPFDLPAMWLLGGWIAFQAIVAQSDAAQPVAGAGGDVAYLAPAAGLILGLLPAGRSLGRSIREFKGSITGGSPSAEEAPPAERA